MEFENGDFIRLVKTTREKFNVSIDEAHDLIFADEEMRRLVALRINRVRECRKMASKDIIFSKAKSRLERDGDCIRFRRTDGQR